MTLSRREKVDFTAMTFLTGGSILSLAGSGIDAIANLAGQVGGRRHGNDVAVRPSRHICDDTLSRPRSSK